MIAAIWDSVSFIMVWMSKPDSNLKEKERRPETRMTFKGTPLKTYFVQQGLKPWCFCDLQKYCQPVVTKHSMNEFMRDIS